MRAQSIAILILLLTLVSCNNDGYSLGDFQVSMATIKTEDGSSYYILLDNGKKLWPAAPVDNRYEPKNDQRAFVNYTLLSDEYGGYDHTVKVNAIWNILTKNVIDLDKDNEEEIGNDPVNINYVWIANDFLNIDFMFNYGGIRPHFINLVNNTITNELGEEEEVIELEFRHNSYESGNNKYLTEGLVSFNIKSLQRDDANSVKIRIKVKEFDGEKTYDTTYNYNNNAEARSSHTEPPVLVVASDEYY